MRFGIQDDLKNRIKYMNVNEVGIISFSLSKINIAPSNVELLLNINEKIMSEINDVKPEVIKAFSMVSHSLNIFSFYKKRIKCFLQFNLFKYNKN